eukprot:scaffold19477_cov110-Isochrysis_galbana.AAC.1
MHKSAGDASDTAKVFEQANQGAIFGEAGFTAKRILDGLLCSEYLLAWHCDDAKRGKDEDSHPYSPDAEGALLWDGHDEACVVCELAPGS